MENINSNKLLKLFLYLVLFTIIAPMIILLLWAFAGRWPWPDFFPEIYSLRAIKEVSSVHSNIFPVLVSSILLSLIVAILSAIISTMTARALTYYHFAGEKLISLLSIAPLLVPASVFAMGIHVTFIKMSLTDTILGVIIVHLIYTLPYSISIMKDLTESIGVQMELQAYVLGVSPLKSFVYITLPLLLPGIMASISMAYISSFSQYFLTLLIGGGKIKTISTIMVPFVAKGDRSLSSAYALLFVISSLLVFAIINRLVKMLSYQGKKEEYN